MKKESYLYKKLDKDRVHCQTCAHRCQIMPGKKGICGIRKNIDGRLFLLNWGQAIAANIDPIEKKPLYYFLPGTQTYSVATIGCNFRCANCQNFEISQISRLADMNDLIIENSGNFLPPEKIIEEAIKFNCPSISYTYTEPTVFLEYALDTMKLAKQKGLKNIWVTNGYMSQETLELIAPYLDAANVDLKSFDEKFYQKICGASLKPILENLKLMKKFNIWIEITTLCIPKLSDSEKMFKQIADFIKQELGLETPWHISRFFPDLSPGLKNLAATPINILKKAQQIGLESGLKSVHIGNI